MGYNDLVYDEWKIRIKEVNQEFWYEVDDWIFPKPKGSYKNVIYHLCKLAWQRDNMGTWISGSNNLHPNVTCHVCEEKVPDNIKMISRLLSW